MKRIRSLFPLVAVVAVLACASSSCGKLDTPFKWPDVAACGSDVGNLVGVVTQLLLNDTGDNGPSESTKAKLEQLARQHGAASILCLVDRLSRDWTAMGASQSPERFAAAQRGKTWLAGLGTQIQHVE